MFVSSSQFFIMAPLLPMMERELGVSEELLGLIVGIYSIALGISALFAGSLSDRVGRRRILKIGSLIMAISLLLHVFAINFQWLLVLRLMAGISGGLLTGSCVSYVRDYFPYKQRGKANGIIITGSATGQILGIPAGILLANQFGFASPFLILGGLMLLSFLLIHGFVPQPLTINSADQERVRFKEAFIQYVGLIRRPVYQKASLGYIFMFFSVTTYLIYFPKWMEATKGAKGVDMAFVFLLGGVASLVGGPIAGWLSDKVGRKSVTITTSLIMAGAMGTSLFFLLDVMAVSIIFFLVMLCLSGRSIAFQSGVSDITAENTRGKAMNLMIAIGQIGMAGGASLAGTVYHHFGFEANTILAISASLAMAGVVMGKWLESPEPKALVHQGQVSKGVKEKAFVEAPELVKQL